MKKVLNDKYLYTFFPTLMTKMKGSHNAVTPTFLQEFLEPESC